MKNDTYAVTSVGLNWCVVNTRNHVKRIVGPIGNKKTNYFDKAMELAAKRMGVTTDKVSYIPDYFSKL